MRLTRRAVLKAAGAFGMVGATGFWDLMRAGKDVQAAVPEEATSIEALTKGRVKVGDIIDGSNADLVKDLLPETIYQQIKGGRKHKRVIKIGPPVTDPEYLILPQWLEATERNQGQAVMDADGNVWTKERQPWVGGTPFPIIEPGDRQAAVKAMQNWNMSQNRNDDVTLPFNAHIWISGDRFRAADGIFALIETTARVFVDPRPSIPGYETEKKRKLLLLKRPTDLDGLSVATVQPYDQKQLPESYGYVPGLRRIKRFSTTDRFSLILGGALFNSDLSGFDDPLLTWSHKFVGTKTMLLPLDGNYASFPASDDAKTPHDPQFSLPADQYKTHFLPNSIWSLRPGVLVVESTPTGWPMAPYARSLQYIDPITGLGIARDWWDKQGRLWKSFVRYFCRFKRQPQGDNAWNTTLFQWVDLQSEGADNFDVLYAGLPGLAFQYGESEGLDVTRYFTVQALIQLATS